MPADFTVAMGLMSGSNSSPGAGNQRVGGSGDHRSADARRSGQHHSAYVIFDVNYTGFTAATSLTGLVWGSRPPGQTSTVAIDSGLAGPVAVNSSGAGNLHYETEVDLTRAHAMM